MDKFIKYLEILELDINADINDIKAAYRKLVKIHHPDLFKNPENKAKAAKNFKIITKAFNYLQDNYIPLENRAFTQNKETKTEFKTYTKDKNDSLIQLLKMCITNGSRIRIWYKSGYYTNNVTERVILPLELYLGAELKNLSGVPKYNYDKNKMYLIAFCELRQEQRMFRVDRILEVEIYKDAQTNLVIEEDIDEKDFNTEYKTTKKQIIYFCIGILIIVRILIFIIQKF